MTTNCNQVLVKSLFCELKKKKVPHSLQTPIAGVRTITEHFCIAIIRRDGEYCTVTIKGPVFIYLASTEKPFVCSIYMCSLKFRGK